MSSRRQLSADIVVTIIVLRDVGHQNKEITKLTGVSHHYLTILKHLCNPPLHKCFSMIWYARTHSPQWRSCFKNEGQYQWLACKQPWFNSNWKLVACGKTELRVKCKDVGSLSKLEVTIRDSWGNIPSTHWNPSNLCSVIAKVPARGVDVSWRVYKILKLRFSCVYSRWGKILVNPCPPPPPARTFCEYCIPDDFPHLRFPVPFTASSPSVFIYSSSILFHIHM